MIAEYDILFLYQLQRNLLLGPMDHHTVFCTIIYTRVECGFMDIQKSTSNLPKMFFLLKNETCTIYLSSKICFLLVLLNSWILAKGNYYLCIIVRSIIIFYFSQFNSRLIELIFFLYICLYIKQTMARSFIYIETYS